MSAATLHYKWQGHEGQIALSQEGVWYIDLSEPKVMAYPNPTEGKRAVLTVGKNKIFLVFEGEGLELGADWKSLRGFEARFDKEEEFSIDFQKHAAPAVAYVRRYAKKPLVVVLAVFFGVALLLLANFKPGDRSETSKMEMDLSQVSPDISSQELAQRRLALAENYLREKNTTLAIDLLDKVLAFQPDHLQAMRLKEKALALQGKSQTEAQSQLKRELHIKALLDDASEMMGRSDLQGAQLVIEQVLSEDPNHAEAYRMGEEIKKALQKTNEEKTQVSLTDDQRAQTVETLWREGRQLFDEKKYADARDRLSRADKMIADMRIQPVFRLDLKDTLDQSETALTQAARPLVEKARQARNAGDASTGLSQIRSYQESLGAYFEAEAVFADYPLLKQEIALTVERMDRALDSSVSEAQTVLGLEGCCAAEPYLQKIITLAKYERVPQYLKAKELLAQCPCQ